MMTTTLRPRYACVLLHDMGGHWLFERRPRGARYAAGRLTCFGGRIEAGELALGALRRECREELGVVPGGLRPAVDLVVGSVWMARFFAARPLSLADIPRRQRLAVVSSAGWQQAPLSRWHRAVLAAWGSGRRRVCLAESLAR